MIEFSYYESEEYSTETSIFSLRKTLRIYKEKKLFFSIGLPSIGDDAPENLFYLDAGSVTIYNEHLSVVGAVYTFTFDQWYKDFTVNKDIPKPFWFHGKRYTPEEFEGLLILIV